MQKNSKNQNKSFSLSLVSWALNEEENIGDFLDNAINFCKNISNDYEIIIIDDGSTDRTFEIGKRRSELNSKIRIYQNGKNLGVGSSLKRAIQLASKNYVIWQTQDWSYDLTWFEKNAALFGDYDIIHGVRKIDISLTDRSDNKLKAIISFGNFF